MSVEILDSAMKRLLTSSTGPVGLHVEKLAKRVTARARVNASAAGFRPAFFRGEHPPTPFMRSQDLFNQLTAHGPFNSPLGAYWHVGSGAKRAGISYPALIEKGGISKSGKFYQYPYLIPALPPDFLPR
jgi:hypothetical protein